jgi:radical SAM-linked protein
VKARIRFSKLGKVRFTSHRDVARMWERAFRRVELPLAYTAGFSPRPKVSFGLALPTGHESVAEYLDVDLASEEIDVDSLAAPLSAALPVGVDVMAAAVLADGSDSLQQIVTSCTWEVTVIAGARAAGHETAAGAGEGSLRTLVSTALAADALPITRERKGQTSTEDVRPGILSVELIGDDLLRCELATQPRGLRPAELLRALDPSLEEGRVRRTHQWISRDGAREEPLLLDATAAPQAPELEPVS